MRISLINHPKLQSLEVEIICKIGSNETTRVTPRQLLGSRKWISARWTKSKGSHQENIFEKRQVKTTLIYQSQVKILRNKDPN